MRLLALALLGFAAISGADASAATIDTVRARGQLLCGVSSGLPGFSAPDERGAWKGLDVDVCRAVAAAVFGDATKVRFVPLSTQQRITALQTGEVDVLSRNLTWTMGRDAGNSINFGPTVYYDGQGFLVKKSANVTSIKSLNGATVCTGSGTTNDQNIADYARANGISLRTLTTEKEEDGAHAFFGGRCDALSADASQLASFRASMVKNPDDYVILPELISKEPLTPAVRHGDDQWFDILKWTVFALIQAEESGVTSANIDSFAKTTSPELQRLLGYTGSMGKPLGLEDGWARNAIKQVGNYGEIYERNVGKGSALKLDRGLNAQWNKGGLLYAPPIR
ncbi:amino acid ABC transporter substrate-binding protein [Roseiterribacter gracilis]|uniref:Amino acid ABC transporter substrate-binding protein n=1 Tax=Roseiterribacter gracilis TaxID=2812848 RepID=A0A8S8X9K1_9PROT|nr:amino acid ABC transporter substrate-binding protein [Rhodospirillales bacterium TMPK1]